MEMLIVVAAGLFGLIIGSFLNVVIWRLPRGESIVSPPSACPSCHTPIRTRDNIPVVSWLLLRGRCRACGARISARYPLVEAGTGVLFALAAWLVGPTWTLPAALYLAAISVALSVIDLDHHLLPNAIVLPSYPVVLGLLLLPAVAEGRMDDLVRAALGGLALFVFYYVLALIYPAGMGMGDVKLAGILGMYLGWMSWGVLVVGGFLGFVFGALIGGVLMAVGRAGRKTRIPFGPFMIAGTLTGLVWGQAIADWYVGRLG